MFCENPRIIFVLFYDVHKENMFTINLEDGCEAPSKASLNKLYKSIRTCREIQYCIFLLLSFKVTVNVILSELLFKDLRIKSNNVHHCLLSRNPQSTFEQKSQFKGVHL